MSSNFFKKKKLNIKTVFKKHVFNKNFIINDVKPLHSANKNDLTFFDSIKYKSIAIKTKAGSAMKNIKHVNDPYTDYFSKENLIERTPSFVLELEKLDADFYEFCKKLKLEIIELPKEKKLTHKGDYSNNKELSEGAILNLKKWYKDDFDLYYFILENKKNWNIGK